MMLNTARRPDGIVGWMFEKKLPSGEGCFDAGLLDILGEGAALKEVVEAIAGFSVFLFAVTHFGIFLVRFHPIDVVIAVGLAECAVMEEVVSHPNIDHGGLRRDRFYS